MSDPVMVLFAATKTLVPKIPAVLKATTAGEFDSKFGAIEDEVKGWYTKFKAAGASDMAVKIGELIMPLLQAIPVKSAELGATKGRKLSGEAAAAAGGKRRKTRRMRQRRGGKARSKSARKV